MKKQILTLFLLFPWFVFSQTVVTLEECQQWAICQSSANVQKELNTQLLKVKLDDAASHLFPTLEVSGCLSYQSHTPQLPLELGVDKLSKDHYGIYLDFQQVLYAGSKLFNGRQYERMMNNSEINKLDLSINALKEQIISIYLNLLILEKQILLLSSVENTIEEQLIQLKKLLESGVIYGNTVAQLELEALKIEQQKGELASTIESLEASLSIITGKNLHGVNFVVPEIPVIERNSTSSRLEFSIFDYSKKGLDYQRKFHLSNSLPSFTFFASGGYGRPAFNIFSNKFDWNYIFGIKFNIPVIAWVKTSGIINIITLQKKILESQERDFEKSNQIAIEEKWNEIIKIENLILLDKKITEKYKTITETSKVQLFNGMITAYDFIKQQNDELQSLINQEVHLMQLLKAKFEFLALKGEL
ncbi:MAG: TolC family protein [Bacteroidetes bacterium]|nr:TolC family protein [Bacteroidota bacterium]MCL1968367.1 TolC family protein [Bacteroidota bacterium]